MQAISERGEKNLRLALDITHNLDNDSTRSAANGWLSEPEH
jgi:hypothetical protein